MTTAPAVAAKSAWIATAVFSTCLLLLGSGCGDSSTGDSNDGLVEDEPITVPISRLADIVEFLGGNPNRLGGGKINLAVPAGEIVQEIYELPSMGHFGVALTELSYDLEETLKSVTIETASAKPNTQGDNSTVTKSTLVSVRVAPAEERETVCSEGELYGPFLVNINGDNEPMSVDPPRATISQSTLGITNRGPYVVCLEVLSDIEANFTIGNVVMTPQLCSDFPENIAGIWSGNYTCENRGCDSDGGPIQLTVTQSENGYSAHYEDDGGATYDGTVCGNVFRFNGGTEGYSESGTFTLQSSTRAKKESDWIDDDASCGGRCDDSLERSE